MKEALVVLGVALLILGIYEVGLALDDSPSGDTVLFGLVIISTGCALLAAASAEAGSARRRWLTGIGAVLVVAIFAVIMAVFHETGLLS